MDQASQDNELQRAIDDITKNAGGEQGDVAADLEQQIQNQMGTPPVPPMPDVAEPGAAPAEVPAMDAPAAPAMSELPMPEGMDAPAVEPATPEVAAETETVGTPAGDVSAEAVAVEAPAEGAADVAGEPAAEVTVDETVAVPEAAAEPMVATETATVELNDMGGNDINTVKEAMLRDLFPIMDKVDMAAEEKFELYKTMLDDNNDKSLIAGAYEVVKGIADEAARAEALLFLIKKADA